MKFDFSTAYLVFASVYVLSPLVLLIILWHYRDRQTNWWCYGSILSGVGLLLVGSRGLIPDILSFQLAQFLVVFGIFSRIWALRYEFQDRNRFLPLIYFAVYSLYILGFHLFIEMEINSRARLIYTNIFFIFTTSEFGYINYKLKKLYPNRLSFSVFVYIAIFQILSFGYATYTLTKQPETGPSFAYSTYHYVILVSLLILTIFANYAFLKLKIEKISDGHAEEQIELAKKIILQQEDIKNATEREKLMGQLNKSTRASALGMFASAIAHEINQPLSSIRLNAQLLLRSAEQNKNTDPDFTKVMNRIVADNRRATDIIKTLRTLLIEGHEQYQEIDLNSITEEIIPSTNLKNIDFDIELKNQLSKNKKLIYGNKTQIQLAILNLINNAVDSLKETNRHKEIKIFSQETPAHDYELCIEDSGNGISPEQMKSIFQPFSTSKTYGMGIGLAISQSIIHNHFGEIKAENMDHSGARFTLSLPNARKGQAFFKNRESIQKNS